MYHRKGLKQSVAENFLIRHVCDFVQDGKVGGFTAIKARSNNPTLEGGSKAKPSGRGQKASYNSIPNVVENINYPAFEEPIYWLFNHPPENKI